MRIMLFEDRLTENLTPITTSRPAYAISCGSYRLIDMVRELGGSIYADVRPHLQPIQQADFDDIQSSESCFDGNEPVCAINARMVPSLENLATLRRLIAASEPGAVKFDDSIAAMLVPPAQHSAIQDTEGKPARIADKLALIEDAKQLDVTLPLFAWPHEVINWNMTLIGSSLDHRIAKGDYEELQDGVFVAKGASIGEFAVIDTSDGPIVLDQDVEVGPFCYLSGPVYAGPRTRVIEHAALKDCVALGHTTKIGGEVEASVIEPYTNKQHHGFLGHSYLGSWINLGAGTCNSDLKNTYGKINIEYNGQRVPSGMQFLGCVVGDYAKTAINTGIFTGKVIGVCSMLYGFVTENVPSFLNYAQMFGQIAEIPPEVMIATQARMFARRSVSQRECDIELVRAMYTLTGSEREQTNQIVAF